VPLFTLTSDDVADDTPLDRAQWGAGGGGGDVSPQLSWSGFPAETKSFAVTIHDPDAPTGSGFWHWAVYNIPASVTSLPAGAGAEGGANLPQGAAMLSNELRSKSFTGAGPPPGTGTHHYNIVVHALDLGHPRIQRALPLAGARRRRPGRDRGRHLVGRSAGARGSAQCLFPVSAR